MTAEPLISDYRINAKQQQQRRKRHLFLHSPCFRCMFLQQLQIKDIIDSDYISVEEIVDINLRKLHNEVQLFHKDKQEKV